MNQFADSAVLYEKGQKYEKAAAIYIDPLKDFKKAAPLMDKIYTPKLHSQYAKAKEGMKEYKDAAKAFERAGDNDSVVRLYLQHLSQPFKAIDIVRKTHSAKAAQMVAQYCKRKNNHAGAIEFLLMAKRSDEAFDIATKSDNMGQFVSVLGENGRPEQYMRIARYYENKQD
jgi:WD repeat-containing protein 19